MPLACEHPAGAVAQIQPTIDLLAHLDTWHPQVLQEHGIVPEDYHPKMVFRSAVESIRGNFIASSTTGRHEIVGNLLARMQSHNRISSFAATGRGTRYDFEVEIEPNRARMAAIEVKGGEGNSLNISQRPLFATEFIVWCHIDGAIVNQPRQSAIAIIGRLTADMVRRHKQIDALIIKDRFCGTPARPCPKFGHTSTPWRRSGSLYFSLSPAIA